MRGAEPPNHRPCCDPLLGLKLHAFWKNGHPKERRKWDAKTPLTLSTAQPFIFQSFRDSRIPTLNHFHTFTIQLFPGRYFNKNTHTLPTFDVSKKTHNKFLPSTPPTTKRLGEFSRKPPHGFASSRIQWIREVNCPQDARCGSYIRWPFHRCWKDFLKGPGDMGFFWGGYCWWLTSQLLGGCIKP